MNKRIYIKVNVNFFDWSFSAVNNARFPSILYTFSGKAAVIARGPLVFVGVRAVQHIYIYRAGAAVCKWSQDALATAIIPPWIHKSIMQITLDASNRFSFSANELDYHRDHAPTVSPAGEHSLSESPAFAFCAVPIISHRVAPRRAN